MSGDLGALARDSVIWGWGCSHEIQGGDRMCRRRRLPVPLDLVADHKKYRSLTACHTVASWRISLCISNAFPSVLPPSQLLPLSMPPDHMSLWTTVMTSTAGPIASLVDAYRVGIRNITVIRVR